MHERSLSQASIFLNRSQDVPNHGSVFDDHAFRQPTGTRGIDHVRRIAGRSLAPVFVTRVYALCVGTPFGTDFQRPRVKFVSRFAVRKHDFSAGLPECQRNTAARDLGIQGDEGATRFHDREHSDKEVGLSSHIYGDEDLGPDSASTQIASRRFCTSIQLCEGIVHSLSRYRDRVRSPGGLPLDEFVQAELVFLVGLNFVRRLYECRQMRCDTDLAHAQRPPVVHGLTGYPTATRHRLTGPRGVADPPHAMQYTSTSRQSGPRR
ncbi:hypothetical protein SUDANB176_07668 (plasmid) [Streptomyces sp. enrichment culture]